MVRQRFWFWAWCTAQGFLATVRLFGALTLILAVAAGVVLPSVGVYTLFQRADSLGAFAVAVAVVAVLLLIFLAEGAWREIERVAPFKKNAQQLGDSGNIHLHYHVYGDTAGAVGPISETFDPPPTQAHTLGADDDPASGGTPRG